MADTWTDEELGAEPADGETEAPTWWAAATTVDITPTWPLPLAGFADRTEPYTSIRSRLEANILLLRPFDENEQSIALISVDLLYAGDVCAPVQAWGAERNIVAHLAASHTHYAPATDSSKPLLGKVDPAYVDLVVNAIIGGFEQLLTEEPPAEPCMVSHAHTTAPYGVRRRKKGMKLVRSGSGVRLYRGVVSGPDRKNPPINNIDVISLTAGDRVVASIWSGSCHPTAAPKLLAIDAEYPDVVRTHLRSQGSRQAVLFLQGAGGDVRPSTTVPNGLTRVVLAAREALLGRPPWRRPSAKAAERWATGLAEEVALLQRHAHSEPLRYARATATHANTGLRNSQADSEARLSAVRISLGPTAQLVGFNVEVLTDTAELLRETLPARGLLIAGCIDNTFGYWPTNLVLAEGGYEATGHYSAFSLDGCLTSPPDQLLRSLLHGTEHATERDVQPCTAHAPSHECRSAAMHTTGRPRRFRH